MNYIDKNAKIWMHDHPLKREVTDEDVAQGYAAPIDDNGFYLVTADFNIWSNKTHKFLRGSYQGGTTWCSWRYCLSGIGNNIGVVTAYNAARKAFPEFAAFEFPEEYWDVYENCAKERAEDTLPLMECLRIIREIGVVRALEILRAIKIE